MGVPGIYKISRIAEGRSIQRATPQMLAAIRDTEPDQGAQGAWPRDEQASLLLKSPQQPTKTIDFISYDQIVPFTSIAPGSAALQGPARCQRPAKARVRLRGGTNRWIPGSSPGAPTTQSSETRN
jgi:hypothetical protein